ncbi:phospho-sugar mutase [Apibacter muscae]|uniref:phospho-sugar mutase n=1 Tax=Apibacter muscae TaxID=2509004 RepID=UPI0011AD9F3F|nr:phospho-sugar mutase [Apibacter muscae]TWP22705.1 phospho-sugar mutase [Apibacter muscae]
MNYSERAKSWLREPFDKDVQKEVQYLIENNPEELEDAFYKDLEFGTGGMRGIMGVGTNRLNRYTYGQATQGLANYLVKEYLGKKISVAIAYDVRHNSDVFAKIVADVLTANGIHVYLFKEFRPTPELSFAVRELNCEAGIVLTASHNPPEYNGFKVYGKDGAQIVPPEDEAIIQEVRKVDYSEIKFNGDDTKLTYLSEDLDQKFIDTVTKHASFLTGKKDLKIVYTPLHGTSIQVLPQVLKQAGYENVFIVPEQQNPDGNFSTVKSPNPEEPEALSIALKYAEEQGADIVFGTDPDADRLGIAVRGLDGKMVLLNGNQANTILTDYVLKKWKENVKINGKQFIGTTIVTSDIFYRLAEAYGVECRTVLTGFKWIADLIKKSEGQEQFICGGEESFGFMLGDYVRDKDSISSILLACEVAQEAKNKGKTLFNILLEIYHKVGFYYEELISIVKKGKDGALEISSMMEQFRTNPPKELIGEKVVQLDDYKNSTSLNPNTGEKTNLDLPKSNVLIFYTDKGTKLACRPSGTEPKIKFYFSVNTSINNDQEYKNKLNEAKSKIDKLKEFVQ